MSIVYQLRKEIVLMKTMEIQLLEYFYIFEI